MTVGSRNLKLSSDTRNVYWSTWNTTTQSWGTPSLQSTSYEVKTTSSKTWNGADRTVVITPRNKGVLKYYHVPVRVRYKDKATKRMVEKTVLKRRSYRDGYTPRRVQRLSLDVPHAYTMSSTYFKDSRSNAILYNANGTYKLKWIDESIFRRFGSNIWRGPVVSFDSNDQLRLISKLREEIRGSDFNLGVFLGESHQTLGMLASSASRLASAYVHARKGRWHSAAKSLVGSDEANRFVRKNFSTSRSPGFSKTGSALWLELQYGWLPLLNDIDGAAKQLAYVESYPKQKRYRATIRKRGSNAPARTDWQYVTWDKLAQRKLIAIVEEQPSKAFLSGLTEPELIAWELVPFSFVADWIAPIGTYLEARGLERSIKATYVTTDFTSEKRLGVMPVQYNVDGTYYVMGPSDYAETRVTLTRSVSTTLDVPFPAVKPLGKIASWQHCANALALLVQAVKVPLPSKAGYRHG